MHSRLKLRFGDQYGLIIKSCPDEGMLVQIHIPYTPYTAETQKILESGKYSQSGKTMSDGSRTGDTGSQEETK